VGELIGFVSVPRTAELPRSAGAFFSAVVQAKVGPGTWQLNLGGRNLNVNTELNLSIGQSLRLQLTAQQGSRWILRILETPPNPEFRSPGETSLMAAFLSRGLPLLGERLQIWTRWLRSSSVPSDGEAWAASLEARGNGPGSVLADGVLPWLAWQKTLEEGHPEHPPDTEEFWDLWNSHQSISGDPWLVLPLHWEYEGISDSGLLQAHWNPQSQTIDQWNLTAAPAGIAFRLESHVKLEMLEWNWYFFQESDRIFWRKLAARLEKQLASGGSQVRLNIMGKPSTPLMPPGGVNVRI